MFRGRVRRTSRKTAASVNAYFKERPFVVICVATALAVAGALVGPAVADQIAELAKIKGTKIATGSLPGSALRNNSVRGEKIRKDSITPDRLTDPKITPSGPVHPGAPPPPPPPQTPPGPPPGPAPPPAAPPAQTSGTFLRVESSPYPINIPKDGSYVDLARITKAQLPGPGPFWIEATARIFPGYNSGGNWYGGPECQLVSGATVVDTEAVGGGTGTWVHGILQATVDSPEGDIVFKCHTYFTGLSGGGSVSTPRMLVSQYDKMNNQTNTVNTKP